MGQMTEYDGSSQKAEWVSPQLKRVVLECVVHTGEEPRHFSLSKLMGEQATTVTLPTAFRAHTAWQKEQIFSILLSFFCRAEPTLY